MISKEKLLTMMSLQIALNKKVHPEWHTQGFAWVDAIMAEGVEALDHYGWKWWKQQSPDLPQVRIELVDIWHFALSIYLERNACDADAASSRMHEMMSYEEKLKPHPAKESFRRLISAAASGFFDGAAFCSLMGHAGLTWDDLYTTYVAKNVLNTFRQDNGYKAGTYIKVWNGQEDNVALDQLMSLHPAATPEGLYNLLADMYDEVTQPC